MRACHMGALSVGQWAHLAGLGLSGSCGCSLGSHMDAPDCPSLATQLCWRMFAHPCTRSLSGQAMPAFVTSLSAAQQVDHLHRPQICQHKAVSGVLGMMTKSHSHRSACSAPLHRMTVCTAIGCTDTASGILCARQVQCKPANQASCTYSGRLLSPTWFWHWLTSLNTPWFWPYAYSTFWQVVDHMVPWGLSAG